MDTTTTTKMVETLTGTKFYLLYSDKNQSKLLTSAKDKDEVKSESEYYTNGVWFEYDCVSGSNVIVNEKTLKGVVFPETAKSRPSEQRYVQDINGKTFKWIS